MIYLAEMKTFLVAILAIPGASVNWQIDKGKLNVLS
jgi:hypothetical protein